MPDPLPVRQIVPPGQRRSRRGSPERRTVTQTADPGSERADGSSRDWRAPFRVDARLTLIVHQRGRGDPTFRIDAGGAIWRTSLTPAGPATLRLTADPPGAVPDSDSPGWRGG